MNATSWPDLHQSHPGTRQSEVPSAYLPKWFATPQVQGAHATVWAAVWMKRVPVCHLSSSVYPLHQLPVPKSQSLSVRANADHGIFLSTQPL